MGAMVAATRHISASCRIPPTLRPAPTRPATCSMVRQPEVQVPLGAVLDDGRRTGVWVFDSAASTVHFRPVKLARLTSESAVISGLSSDDRVVSLGAHLLQEGARVRTAPENRSN